MGSSDVALIKEPEAKCNAKPSRWKLGFLLVPPLLLKPTARQDNHQQTRRSSRIHALNLLQPFQVFVHVVVHDTSQDVGKDVQTISHRGLWWGHENMRGQNAFCCSRYPMMPFLTIDTLILSSKTCGIVSKNWVSIIRNSFQYTSIITSISIFDVHKNNKRCKYVSNWFHFSSPIIITYFTFITTTSAPTPPKQLTITNDWTLWTSLKAERSVLWPDERQNAVQFVHPNKSAISTTMVKQKKKLCLPHLQLSNVSVIYT